MGQIKNIKLHIVTDIKIKNPKKFPSLTSPEMSFRSDSGSEKEETTSSFKGSRRGSIRGIGRKIRNIKFRSSFRSSTSVSELSESSPSLRHKKSTASCADMMFEHQEPEIDKIDKIESSVWYLGYREARSPGLAETIETANKIYEHHKPFLKTISKSFISVDMDGIRIKEIVPIRRTDHSREEERASLSDHEDMTEKETLYKSPRIKYCGVLKSRPRVLLFNYQHGARSENLHIHVVVCKDKDTAKSIAKTLKKDIRHIKQDQSSERQRQT